MTSLTISPPLSTPMSFLHLPLEIRLQIYSLHLQPIKLFTRPILDPEWLFSTHRGLKPALPALLFVHPKIYYEAAPIFYSLATLEIKPNQSSPHEKQSISAYLAQYEASYSFCNTVHLSLIKTVHVFCDQEWVVDSNCFRALFLWLVENTRVTGIYLSRKVMQQSRHLCQEQDAETGMINLEGARLEWRRSDLDGSPTSRSKTIDLYARSVSSRLRGLGNCLATRTKPLPGVQLYSYHYNEEEKGVLYAEQGHADAQNATRDALERETREAVSRKEMERFASMELADGDMRQTHKDGYLWLYKTIQIRCLTDLGMKSILSPMSDKT